MGFKLKANPPPVTVAYPGSYLLMVDAVNLPTFGQYECLIRAFSKQPTSAPQSPFVNSYRSYKQQTQHVLNYAFCSVQPNTSSLTIDVPRSLGLTSDDTYY
jgi:hypothetical protein